MRESKIDEKTGKTLYKVQPEGLPALWIEDGLCDRCLLYGRCLGFQSLNEEEWTQVNEKLKDNPLNEELLFEIQEKYNLDLYISAEESVRI